MGLEFANEVYETIQRILDFPNAWQSLDNDIRRCLINRFPFGIIYYQRDDEIIIFLNCSMHSHRNLYSFLKTSSTLIDVAFLAG